MNIKGKTFTFYSLIFCLFFSIIGIVYVFTPPVFATGSTYYISPTGSDTNPGTHDQPWKTISKASTSLIPGDSVILLPGTYLEKLISLKSGTNGNYITYSATPGTAILDGTNITLNSTNGKGDGLIQIIGTSYIKIQGLTVRNSSVNCVNISSDDSGVRPNSVEISNLTIQNCKKVGIKVRQGKNILIKDNSIKHTDYSSGIGIWNSEDVIVDHNIIDTPHWYHECQGAFEEGLSVSNTNRFEVKYNTLSYTEAPPIGYCSGSQRLGIDVKESSQNGSVHNNNVSNFDAAGIYVDGWHAGANGTSTLNHINIFQNYIQDSGGIKVGCEQPDGIVEYINIYNNVVINSYFSGIEVRKAWGNGLRKNITIYNNIVFGANPKGGNGGAGIAVTTSNLKTNNADSPVIIRNNISNFYFLSSGGGTVGQIRSADAEGAKLITADHNIVFGPMSCSQEYPNCIELGTRTTADPTSLFVDPSIFNLHTKSTSSAIDNGLDIMLVSQDYDGVVRPQMARNDIGAYEYRLAISVTPIVPTAIPTAIPTSIPSPTHIPLPSDLDHNGIVDILDYNQLVADFGRVGSTGFIPADIEKNGQVDIFDYNRLLEDFGKRN